MSYRKPMSFWTFNFLGLSTYDSIMIFTPNILVDYQDGLLSEGGEGTISKMCVQFNILDSFLIFVPKTQLSFLKNRQLGSNICPGPNQLSRGPTV